jgi:hypothetical protein
VSKKPNISGQKFNFLTAIKFEYSKNNRHFWLFKCDCGNEKIIGKTYVLNDHTKSCGCWKLQNNRTIGITHNQSKTREFEIWLGIKKRCLNKNCHAYKDYGARGIMICDKWLISFEEFLADMGHAPSELYSIDRIDNNGNYEPSNCRWVTRKEQNNNTRRNRIFSYEGNNYTLSNLCDKLGLKYKLIYDRVTKLNWSLEEAICHI